MRLALCGAALALASCELADPNSQPRYGETGLPSNCRAFVQYAINTYRAGQYTAEETINSLERNCGINGHSWGQ